MITLLIIIALLTANAFFVAAEFALVKVRRFQLEQAVENNVSGGVLTLKIHKNLDAYLAACQLGITMASLGLGWVGEPAVAAILKPLFIAVGLPSSILHTVSFLIGFILFSSLHIVIGEQVPKIYAIRKPEKVSLLSAYPLQLFYLLVFPLNWLLEKANSKILNLLGVEGSGHGEILSEGEIVSLLDVSAKHGELENKTVELIHNVFAFDDRTVQQVMVPWSSVDVVDLSTGEEAIHEAILTNRRSRFPVVEQTGGEVVGILLTKDLFEPIVRGKISIIELISSELRPSLLVPPTLKIPPLFERMRKERTHMALVIDEYGAYSGIVTLEDLLEEIVGEIDDEWDDELSNALIEETKQGWKISGLFPINDLEAILEISLGDTADCNTLAGYLIKKMQRIPNTGDELKVASGIFTVRKMEQQRVVSVLFERKNPAVEELAEELES